MNSLILCEIDNHPEKQVEIRYLLPHMPSHVIIKQMLKGGGGLPTSPVKKLKLRTVPELTQDRATRASSWAPSSLAGGQSTGEPGQAMQKWPLTAP